VPEKWEGPGFAQFDGITMIDPWYKLEVKEVVSAFYQIWSDLVIPCGKVIKTY
jgi:acetoacetate decarboxylase